VLRQAVRSTALVTSLFPEGVRDRLMDQAQNKDFMLSGKSRLQNFLTGDDAMTTTRIGGGGSQCSAPIADLFPFCTVFFADIAGFTAYSSTREPSQIFILLETIYQAFDVLAKKRGVFKVETIGDSYVAVTGLPSPDKRHALSMARFALDCLKTFKSLTKQLENTLGPDTSELGLRIGLHSGPVTAGVLRGERSRFQLFGDTVNTAARMESTGCANRIQISHATAELLRAEGKDNWIADRSDAVHAKGKGVLATFWLQPNHETSPPTALGNFSETCLDLEVAQSRPEQNVLNQKTERLVNWVVDTFSKHLSKIIAQRSHEPDSMTNKDSLVYRLAPGRTSLDEVVEVIKMPMFNKKASARAKERRSVAIEDNVARQLKEVITRIQALYNSNPFHNFGTVLVESGADCVV
jgi:class 3 adenylate cyclase